MTFRQNSRRWFRGSSLWGDDHYEIICENIRNLCTFAGEGYYYLLDYDGIQLDEPWWLQLTTNCKMKLHYHK